MKLPRPRGPLSAFLFDTLEDPARPLGPVPPVDAVDPLGDEDLQLALYVLYELHYRGFEAVDEAWEWEPTLLGFRRELEGPFEAALIDALPRDAAPRPDGMDVALRAILAEETGPSVSRHLELRGTRDEFLELVAHRSAYQLKEADPHSWAIPRLTGRPKAALVEIQADEYGAGVEARMHSVLFARTMRALGLDSTYGAYLDLLPGVTLATTNLMSLFGLHRRWRGALVGHLAGFEMGSAVPNRRYANALRRLGLDHPDAVDFFEEHVEADSVHENIAAVDLAGGFALQEPELAADVLFGVRALAALDLRFASHVFECWEAGESSLRAPLVHAAPA